MENFIESYISLLADKTGVASILVEMGRQMEDVLKTRDSQAQEIKDFAHAIEKAGRILLLGMGASHCVNEIFSFQLRKVGIDALAIPASEFLYDPIPVAGRVVLLTSQSGESVETVKCLDLLKGEDLYGITLERASTIGSRTKSIIVFGGNEKAFAGTRSVTLSLAVMAYVCERLGLVTLESIDASIKFRQSDYVAMHQAVGLLYAKHSVVTTGRSLFSGLAQLFSLGGEELGGKPILCNETGQLRHGPLEVLSPDAVVVVFRQSGELGGLARSFNEIKRKTGCSLLVIDSSGMDPLEDAVTVRCPTGSDIAATLGVMETFQTLMIAYACGKNSRAGIPKFSSKVTRTE